MPFDPAIFNPSAITDTLSSHGPIILLVMFVAAVIEAGFGLGVLVPGETVVAAGAAALHGQWLLLIALPVVATGAFLGDHIGFLIGRRAGPALAKSAPVRRLGAARWERANDLVRRHGFWTLVVARLLPGIRTLVAAAAGGSGIRYARFALADGLAAVLWSVIWVFGGAALATAISSAAWIAVPTAGLLAVVVILIRRRRGRRAARLTQTASAPDLVTGSQ